MGDKKKINRFLKNNRKYRIKDLFIKGRTVYRRTPACFRWVFLPLKLIVRFIRMVIRFIDNLKLELWIITGEEATSKQKLAIIYAGREKNRNYLGKLAFNGSYREKYISKTWKWKILRKAKKKNHGCFLMVAEVARFSRLFFGTKRCFYIPSWISGEVDISIGMSAFIKNESLKSDELRYMKLKLAELVEAQSIIEMMNLS